MAWYFHIVEQHDGSWLCRHGRAIFDAHPELQHAIDHIRELAAGAQPALLMVHRLDGSVDPAVPI
jgi:hypothetical protein